MLSVRDYSNEKNAPVRGCACIQPAAQLAAQVAVPPGGLGGSTALPESRANEKNRKEVQPAGGAPDSSKSEDSRESGGVFRKMILSVSDSKGSRNNLYGIPKKYDTQ